MSTVALSKHTNIAFVSVTDTVLPTPLNAPGVVSVIFLFYWNFLPHLLLNRNPKGNQLSPVNCHVRMSFPFPSLSISVFHHFKGFFTFTSFLSAPLGNAIFLCSYRPFVIFTASTLRITPAPLCPWEAHPLASGRGVPIYVPVVAFLREGLPLASTAAYQPGSAALSFARQLNCFLHPTDPVLQNSAGLQKNRWME